MPKAPKATGLITINRVVKTPAQTAWLTERLPQFAAAQTEGKLLEFWPKIREQYLAAFPVPGMDDDTLPQEKRHEVADMVHKVRESVYWWFNNKGSDRKRRAGNTSVNVNIDLVSGFSNTAVSSNSRSNSTSETNSDNENDSSSDSEKTKKKKRRASKGKRTHKLTKIFEQEYFDTYRQEYDSIINTLKGENGAVTKSERMKARARLCAEKWAQASSEVKQRVEDLQAAERTKIKGAKMSQASFDAAQTGKLTGEDLEAFILALPNILGEFAENIGKRADIALTIVAAARDPKTRKLKTWAAHHGSNPNGLTFVDAYPKFTETLMIPFTTFARRVISKSKNALTNSATPIQVAADTSKAVVPEPAQAPHHQPIAASDASSGTSPSATNSAAPEDPANNRLLTPTPTPSQSPSLGIDLSVIDPALWPASMRESATSGSLAATRQQSSGVSATQQQSSGMSAISAQPSLPAAAAQPSQSSPAASSDQQQSSVAATQQRSSDMSTISAQPSLPAAQPSQSSPVDSSDQQSSDASADGAIETLKRKCVPDESIAIGEGRGVGKENIPPVTIRIPTRLPQGRRSSGRQRTAKVLGLPKTIVDTQNSKRTGGNGSSSKRAKLS